MSNTNIPATAFAGEVIPNAPAHFNNWAHEPILHQHFDRLRARLLNLAETSTRDKQQAEAMKGLMKDFLNAAFYDSVRDIECFLRDMKVISEGEGKTQPAPLRSKSLDDILYEPKD